MGRRLRDSSSVPEGPIVLHGRIHPARFLALSALIFWAAAGVGAAPASGPASPSWTIDLTALDCYVRQGFEVYWSNYLPEAGDPAWTKIPGRAGNRPVVLRDLDLPWKSPVGRFSLSTPKPDKFCIVTSFDISAEQLDSAAGLGLYLQDVGKNWEVYLNGSAIKSEVHLSRRGLIERERAVHGALVDIDKRFLRPGTNVIAIVIIGQGNDYRTGLFAPGPYLLGDYQRLLRLKDENLDLMLIGIYLFFAIYHLILFALRPDKRPYLFYGLGTLFFGLYLFSRSYLAYDLLPDTAVIRGLELSTLFILFATFLGFFDDSNRGKPSLFVWVYGGICLVFAFIAPFVWGEPILELWQKTLVIPVIYLVVFDCALPIASIVRGKKDGGSGSWLARLWRADNFWTICIASLIAATCVIAAFMDLNSQGAFQAAKIGAFFLIFGTATVLAHQFTSTYRDVEEFNVGLEDKVAERTQALAAAMEAQSSLNANLDAANSGLASAMDVAARDMKIAEQVQEGIFPQEAPRDADWDIAFVSISRSGVSGDFYDFLVEGGKLKGAVLGDVSGEGISTGLIAVLARSIVLRRFHELGGASLGRVLESINGELVGELAAVENYLTLSMLRCEGRFVEYANAGHPDIAFRRKGRAKASFIAPGRKGESFRAPPLGREGIEPSYSSLRFEVVPGDSLLLYSDCLLSSVNAEGEAFGAEGLLSAYGRAPADSASSMLDYIVEEWKFHLAGAAATDDLTAMMLKKK
jgi:serine phosphatase RsbU (regulator of sigma subunit)